MNVSLPAIDPGQATAVDPKLQQAVEQFLYHEARLLDRQRFDDWLDLYTDDAIYWIPSEPGQEDAADTVSIMYESKSVLRMRVRRLGHPRAPGLEPFPQTAHLVGGVTILSGSEDNADIEAASSFVMTEYRNDRTRLFSGSCRHVLRRHDQTFRIAFKRVDLVDCNGLNQVFNIPF